MNKEIVKKFFPEEIKKVEQGLCPTCGKKIKMEDFKDKLSVAEYKISGMCQECQDKVFE